MNDDEWEGCRFLKFFFLILEKEFPNEERIVIVNPPIVPE